MRLLIGSILVASAAFCTAQFPSGSRAEYFDPANWVYSVTQTNTSNLVTYPSNGMGGYTRTVTPQLTTYSQLTLPPVLTSDSIFTKTKYAYKFTWVGPNNIPAPQKVYVLIQANGQFSPSANGNIDLGVASPPKIIAPVDLTAPTVRKFNGDSLRELVVTNGVATLEFEGNVSVSHTNNPGKGNAARAEYYGSADVTSRVLALTVKEPTYENGNSVAYQPPAVQVVNADINEKRVVTSYNQDGQLIGSDLMVVNAVGLWNPVTFTWSANKGAAVWLYNHNYEEGRFLDLQISPSDVLDRRIHRATDNVTVNITGTDTVGSQKAKAKYEIHVPLEEFSVQPLDIDSSGWVFQFSRYPGPTARTVTATEVNGQSDVKEITHSISSALGIDITEFAKLSYNFSATAKIGTKYEISFTDSQSWTVPATPPANPNTSYMFYKRTRTPRNKHLCQQFSGSGYLGGLTQNVDEKSYADFMLDIVEL